ncbi:MAG: hypothetical protein GEU91_10335 [Rhizobiales bacterium]|nr:hypothetical protein [Hyphomicrobiales bacterium]
MKQQIQFCTSRVGVRIAFATAGQGPPLVQVNNWFTHLEFDWDSPVWRHWLEVFAERRKLVLLPHEKALATFRKELNDFLDADEQISMAPVASCPN